MGKKRVRGLSALSKLKSLLTDGDIAFQEIIREKGIFCSFLTYLGVVIATTIVTLIIRLILYSMSDLQILWPDFTNNVLSNTIALLIVPFAATLIIHPLILLLGGRGGIAGTFKVIAYALIPYFIISLIPIVGQLSFVLTLMIAGYGFMRVHNLTQFRAGLAVAIPFLAVYLLMNVVGLWLAINFGLGG